MPSVVQSDAELVEANSKLGVISGITGFVAIIPAALIQVTPLQGWGTLLYSGVLFAYGLASATRLPADVVAATPARSVEKVQLHAAPLQLAAVAMTMLRAAVGFVFFLLAFWLRTQPSGTAWFGVSIGLAARRDDGRQRHLAADPPAAARGADAGGRARAGRGGRLRRRAARRRRRRCAAGGRRQLLGCGRQAGVREHRAARRPAGQPGPSVRPLRDPLPARLGGGRPDPGDHRHPGVGRFPRSSASSARQAPSTTSPPPAHRRSGSASRRAVPRPTRRGGRSSGRPLPPPRPDSRRNPP